MSLDRLVEWLCKLARLLSAWLFIFPVKFRDVGQFEASGPTGGYIFEIEGTSKTNKVVRVPRCSFRIRVVKDKRLLKTADASKVMFGEQVYVFDSLPVLKAHIEGLSYGNQTDLVSFSSQPIRLFLHVTVAGPGSTNPSLRFGLSKIYQSVRLQLCRRWFWLDYIELPIQQVPIIAGNDRTRIVDS